MYSQLTLICLEKIISKIQLKNYKMLLVLIILEYFAGK